MDFDAEQFIIEVQNRPSIWNRKSEKYADKNLRQKAWEELTDKYGADLSQDEKKKLCLELQKKWRHIRDNFLKTHKAKEGKSGPAARKKAPYVFYDKLLFLKDIAVYRTVGKTKINDNETTTAQNADDLSSNTPSPKRNKEYNYDNYLFDSQLVRVSTKNCERKNLEEDDDRFFFLSLVKEFKKIPEDLQMQTKLDILNLIKDAQQISDGPSTSRSGGKRTTNRGYNNALFKRK